MDWGDFETPDMYCGVFLDDGETQLPVTDWAYMMVGGEMAEPIRLRQDSWDASVSVADIASGPVMDFLSPETVRGEGMKLHMEREDSRINDFQELPRDSSGPSCVVTISDVGVRSGMLCLLGFTCPGNSV